MEVSTAREPSGEVMGRLWPRGVVLGGACGSYLQGTEERFAIVQKCHSQRTVTLNSRDVVDYAQRQQDVLQGN